jgi:hypothetical protein
MRKLDGSKRALDLALPKLDEFEEDWIVRCQIVFLPSKTVENGRVVRKPIEELSGG